MTIAVDLGRKATKTKQNNSPNWEITLLNLLCLSLTLAVSGYLQLKGIVFGLDSFNGPAS